MTYRRNIFHYYNTNGFDAVDCSTEDYKHLNESFKVCNNAIGMADIEYVMSCMTAIPPILNTLNHVFPSKYLHGKCDSTEYQGHSNHDAFVKYFRSFTRNSYGFIELPDIMN